MPFDINAPKTARNPLIGGCVIYMVLFNLLTLCPTSDCATFCRSIATKTNPATQLLLIILKIRCGSFQPFNQCIKSIDFEFGQFDISCSHICLRTLWLCDNSSSSSSPMPIQMFCLLFVAFYAGIFVAIQQRNYFAVKFLDYDIFSALVSCHFIFTSTKKAIKQIRANVTVSFWNKIIQF